MLPFTIFRSKIFLALVFLISIAPAKSFANYASTMADTILVNGVPIRQDTITSLIACRLINRDFNDIYVQNLRSSFFGQEFFQPIKTQLVADVVGNFVVYNTPKSRLFVNAFTRVKIRLLNTPGAPVKSPSYIPGIQLFYRLNNNVYNPKFLSGGYTHHSNGVRGPTQLPDGSFNVDSGKFSTNFYTLNYTVGKRTDKPNMVINQYKTIGLEVHSGLFGLGAAEGLPGHYGWIRVNGTYMINLAKAYEDPIRNGHKLFANWQRLQFDFTYIADKYNNYNAQNLKKRLNVSLKYYYHLPFLQDVSVMAGGGYRGQDDYNISFQSSYGYGMIGLASGLSFLLNR
ncbi:hypothetical protein IDJ77_07720 [Mucilaginibacter sp. ZT4R22]|uniref:Solitary outer membrane autotransporter beta-barrel domain-containing protein n=1 Tax=Mucilaginibacter pankratovii TaxID=2772110 RepID=A0ABR7WQT1_9SPHI|nr:hypothetical protein [Mucilaginibacter pankratovii]MBD1363694.1 hypothetical protein [Mucilaginibacter pankratovii]